MSVFICQVCGHVAFDAAPEKCPVCSASKFEQNDNVFEESMKNSKEGSHKHIPSVKINKECGLIPEETCWDVIIRIGETLHPMQDAHFIQFIDCYVDNAFVERIQLTPGVQPAACVHLKAQGSKVKVVEFCNLHGHWQAEAAL